MFTKSKFGGTYFHLVLERASIFSMYTLLKQWCLHWLGHVMRMADGWIPKDLLYGEVVQGNCPRGRLQLQYKEICKQNLQALGMYLNLSLIHI